MRHLIRAAAALALCALVAVFAGAVPQPASARLPPPQPELSADAVRFAVIGDWGTGSRRQRETGQMLWKQRERFPYTFVITTGDNLYGSQDPSAFERKFVVPYKAIIDAKIPFFASIGNHDEAHQVNYPLFNMNGRRYYTFTRGPVQFFALDSTLMTHEQLRWLEDELTRSKAQWKIAYFHHPIYSSGLRHGPTLVLQSALQPIFSTHGVRAIFVGHEHFYERLVPRYGIQQFITGSAGQLRFGNIRRGSLETARGFDTDNSFMLVGIEGNLLTFEAVSRLGVVVDSGTVVLSSTTN